MSYRKFVAGNPGDVNGGEAFETNEMETSEEANRAARRWLEKQKKENGVIGGENNEQSVAKKDRGYSQNGDDTPEKGKEEEFVTIKVPKRGIRVYATPSLSTEFSLSSEMLEKLRASDWQQQQQQQVNDSQVTIQEEESPPEPMLSQPIVPDSWEEWDSTFLEAMHANQADHSHDDDKCSIDSIEEELHTPLHSLAAKGKEACEPVVLIDLGQLCEGMTAQDFDSLPTSDPSTWNYVINADDIDESYINVIAGLLVQLERDWSRMLEILIQRGCARMTNRIRWSKDRNRMYKKNDKTTDGSIVALEQPHGYEQTSAQLETPFVVMDIISVLLKRTNRDVRWREAVFEELLDLANTLHNKNKQRQESLNKEISRVVKRVISLRRKVRSLESSLNGAIEDCSDDDSGGQVDEQRQRLNRSLEKLKASESHLQSLKFQVKSLHDMSMSRSTLHDMLKNDCKAVHTDSVQSSLVGKTISMILSRVCMDANDDESSLKRRQVIESVKTSLLWLWSKEIGSFEKENLGTNQNEDVGIPNETDMFESHEEQSSAAPALKPEGLTVSRHGSSDGPKKSLLLSPEEESAFFEKLNNNELPYSSRHDVGSSYSGRKSGGECGYSYGHTSGNNTSGSIAKVGGLAKLALQVGN